MKVKSAWRPVRIGRTQCSMANIARQYALGVPLSIAKPEYLFNPPQLVRRLLRGRRAGPGPTDRVVTLPWGLPLEVDIAETMGRAVWLLGIYELVVSELLWRLTDPGELAGDVGANIGHMTSLLAARVGPRGRVVAFEPHPEIRAQLERNVARWSRAPVGAVEVRPEAVSSAPGEGRLELPAGENRGIGRLGSVGLEVPVTTLAAVFHERPPAFLKLDIEGAEYDALVGAGPLLDEVRDVIYEDHTPQPGRVAQWLGARGYRVFRVVRSLLGPRLHERLDAPGVAWEPPVFLATREVDRALRRLGSRGWRVLRAS